MTQTLPHQVSITESVFAVPGQVDRESGVIRGVKILGRLSANGREYLESALHDAAELYDGIRVNIDHPSQQAIKAARGTLEQWGWLDGIQVREDGVYGDLHFLKTHPHTEPLLELAERRPDKFGLSHNADCSGHHDGRKQIIENIGHVRSVDVVQRPATTQGLFEHTEDSPMLRKSFRTILESAPVGTRGRKALLKLLEADDMNDVAETSVPVNPDDSSEDQIWTAFRTAVTAILDDDSLDVATMRDQIMKLLDNYSDSFSHNNSSTDESEDDLTADDTDSTTEGINELRREVKLLRREGRARDLLEQHQIQATPGRIKGVASVLESDADLQDLLASLPKRTGADSLQHPAGKPQKPRRSAPLLESDRTTEQFTSLPYKDHKDLARMIR